MSRSAVALAPELELWELPPSRMPQVGHRVLGGASRGLPLEWENCDPGYGTHAPELSPEPYQAPAYAQPPQKAGSLASSPMSRILLAGLSALLMALALAAAGPALAVGSGGRAYSLRISGYTEALTAPAAQGEDPVVIDASSAPLVAAPEAPPQPEPAPPPAPQAASGAYSLLGPPSLSVAQIERVLAEYGSPAAGLGGKMYDLGVRYGIDPAYALAFFVHESGCGTKGVARFTNSLGNIRWTQGFENYEGYRKYASWEQGTEDWYKLITDLYIGAWGLKTVDEIIPVYAPWGDNNHPPTYISSIKSMVDRWRGK